MVRNLKNYAYITVLTNFKYLQGVLVLNDCLKKNKSKYPFWVIIPENCDANIIHSLTERKIQFIKMPNIMSEEIKSEKNAIWYWSETLFKLNIFRLTQFEKVVFLDADMIILKNIDELFERDHLSSVIAGKCLHSEWNGLNSGLIVIEPNEAEYTGLCECAKTVIKEKQDKGIGFGDQDIINYYFKDWKKQTHLHLPETYNAMFGFGKENYIDTLSKRDGNDSIKVAHFIGVYKPWNYPIFKKIIYIIKLNIKGYHKEYEYWKLYRAMLKGAK